MKPVDDPHLPDDRLIMSLVQEDSLDPGELDHLSSCPVCSAERGRIERALSDMGRTAANLTPPFRRRLTLPSHTSRPGFLGPFRTGSGLPNPWMIGAATAAVGFMVAFGWIFSRSTQERRLSELRQEIIDDARFLRELSNLEEYGLPEMSVALSDEFDPDEDDFLDFVVPDPTAEATSGIPAEGNLC